MQTNNYTKVKEFFRRLFKRRKHLKQPKTYTETELIGSGFTQAPRNISDQYKKRG